MSLAIMGVFEYVQFSCSQRQNSLCASEGVFMAMRATQGRLECARCPMLKLKMPPADAHNISCEQMHFQSEFGRQLIDKQMVPLVSLIIWDTPVE